VGCVGRLGKQDDLAEFSASAERVVGGGRVVERIRRGDWHRDPPARNEREHLALDGAGRVCLALQRARALTRAALELIRDEGYETFSLARVAQRVGVSKAAVYHHFKTKDELVQLALLPVIQGLRQIIDTPMSAERRIDCLIDLAIANSEVAAFCTPLRSTDIGDQPITDARALRSELINALSEHRSDGPSGRLRVNAFLGALSGAINSCEHLGEVDELRPALKRLITEANST
jgi:AcrR family transcriptional regulator